MTQGGDGWEPVDSCHVVQVLNQSSDSTRCDHEFGQILRMTSNFSDQRACIFTHVITNVFQRQDCAWEHFQGNHSIRRLHRVFGDLSQTCGDLALKTRVGMFNVLHHLRNNSTVNQQLRKCLCVLRNVTHRGHCDSLERQVRLLVACDQ